MAKKRPTRVTTPVFTASFPHLFTPSGGEGFKEQYSVTAVFDAGADLSKLEKVIEDAVQNGIDDPNKFNGKRPKDLVLPLKDGSEMTDAEDNPRPEFAGKRFARFAADTDAQPKIVDLQMNEILDSKEIYGGVRLRAAVTAYPWKFGGRCGVSLYLNNIQKVADGEPFGVANDPSADFGDDPVS